MLYLDPNAPERWSDSDVAERWLKVYPSKLDKPENATQREMRKLAIVDSPELLKLYRSRLGDLSWFMRRLNEPMTKRRNLEYFVTGRFYEYHPWYSPFGPSSFLRCSNSFLTNLWEGRNTSQALLDETAVLSCMTYVDLNPVRAKITEKLEESEHTSIKKRLEAIALQENNLQLDEAITAMAGEVKRRLLSITLREYTELSEWAGRSIIHPTKPPSQQTLR